MRILWVSRESGDDSQFGLRRSQLQVQTELGCRGHAIRIVTADDPAAVALRTQAVCANTQSTVPDSTLAHLWPVLVNAWSAGAAAAELHAGERVDVVDAQDFITAAAYAQRCRILGIAPGRWGYRQHGFNAVWRALHEFYGPLSARMQTMLRRLERRAALAAQWVIFPTASGLAQWRKDLGLERSSVRCHRLSHPRPVLATADRRAVRHERGWTDSELVVVAAGRFEPLKRFDALIRAMAASPVPARLLLLGGGDTGGLAALAKRLDIGDRVEFDQVSDITPILQAADVYVSTSATEAFGLANAEAVAAGLPCLIAETGAARELFASHARLLAADLSDLQAALNEVLASRNARERLRAQTSGFAGNLPSAEYCAEACEQLFMGAAQLRERHPLDGRPETDR